MTEREEEQPTGQDQTGRDQADPESGADELHDQDSEPSLNAPEEGRPDGMVDQ